jgi:hypothetical protein
MQLNWLHITDFHAGQVGQNRLWPHARHRFFKELPKLHGESGPWDLILFTGDLAFSGQPKQYHQVDALLETLLEKICKLQEYPPILFAVPGNHDLDRSLANAAHNREGLHNHRRWIEDPKLRDIFWDSKTSSIRQAVDEAFAEYNKWWKRQAVWTDPRFTITEGLLPGDFAATFEKDGIAFGILGLNSAFLQLTGDNYEGKLGLDIEQFNAACKGDGFAWADRHCACLLMTHHPWKWLEPESEKTLLNKIMDEGRFALHLCGHMHKTHSEMQRSIDGAPRWLLQARSLFGLEKLGNNTQRLHGHIAGRLELERVEGSAEGVWRVWPRKYHERSGGWAISPDDTLPLDEDSGRISTPPESFDPRPECIRASTKTQPPPDDKSVAQPDTELAKAISAHLETVPVLSEHLCRHLNLSAAEDPVPALVARSPEKALQTFYNAAQKCRRSCIEDAWAESIRDAAIIIFGLLLSRFVRPQRPRGNLAARVVVATEVGAEVLWMHWKGNDEHPSFKHWGERLIGVHNVLGGVCLPATDYNKQAQRIHDAKSALWIKIFSGMEQVPEDFYRINAKSGMTGNQELRVALGFEDEDVGSSYYGTADRSREHDPINDPVVLDALHDDIGLEVFEIDLGTEELFVINERTLMLRIKQCWSIFEQRHK